MTDSTKMNYVYDTYDTIIEKLEALEPDNNIDNIIEFIRNEREDLPSSKEIALQFIEWSHELND